MDELLFAYATAAVIVRLFPRQVDHAEVRPVRAGLAVPGRIYQSYVIQAISYHEWAVGVRGKELVAAANCRALWALVWFLAVYQLGLGRRTRLGCCPRRRGLVAGAGRRDQPAPGRLGPVLRGDVDPRRRRHASAMSGRGSAIFRSFPFVMMVAAIMLIVTGRTIQAPRPAFLPAGLVVAAVVRLDLDVQRQAIALAHRRAGDGLCVLRHAAQAALVARADRHGVRRCARRAIAIGWRNNRDHERSFTGFVHFLGDFDVRRSSRASTSADDDGEEIMTYETERIWRLPADDGHGP